jgi:hypothetical protein
MPGKAAAAALVMPAVRVCRHRRTKRDLNKRAWALRCLSAGRKKTLGHSSWTRVDMLLACGGLHSGNSCCSCLP